MELGVDFPLGDLVLHDSIDVRSARIDGRQYSGAFRRRKVCSATSSSFQIRAVADSTRVNPLPAVVRSRTDTNGDSTTLVVRGKRAMIKKRGRSMIADKGAFLSPSSALLDNHFDELLQTIEEIRGLTAILKSLPSENEKREEYEGWLYAALTHLDHHVKPAIKEWDRVVDRMPND